MPLAPLARIRLECVRHVQARVLCRQPQLLHRDEKLALGLAVRGEWRVASGEWCVVNGEW